MKNIKLFEQFVGELNETYHDMKYDGHDMVLFGKYISTSPELMAIHKNVKETVDGVTMDILMHTYKRAKEEAPDALKGFAEFEKKNEIKGKFPDNMNLILVDDRGNAYRVNNKGMLTQKENKDFSGGWRFVGLADIRFGRTVAKFEDMDEKKVKEIMDKGILYKNRKPMFTVVDNDHGTTRHWGKGLNHMYFEKA